MPITTPESPLPIFRPDARGMLAQFEGKFHELGIDFESEQKELSVGTSRALLAQALPRFGSLRWFTPPTRPSPNVCAFHFLTPCGMSVANACVRMCV
jgi:hypothetical protein